MRREYELRTFLQNVANAVYLAGEDVKLTGLAIARTDEKDSNFTIFEISDSELIIMVKVNGLTVYAGLEGDDLLNDENTEVLKNLISLILRETKKLRLRDITRAGVVYDDMSPDMKEFLYDLMIRHVRGEKVHDQFEAA